jgi:GxxExxY protein
MEINELSGVVIGIAIKVHSELGPGLLESSYKEVLAYKLEQAGFKVEKEKPVPLTSNGVRLECGYRIDILVEGVLVIEIKAVDAFHPIHLAQMLTYLKTGGFHLGLLINFNVILLKDGIKRVIL